MDALLVLELFKPCKLSITEILAVGENPREINLENMIYTIAGNPTDINQTIDTSLISSFERDSKSHFNELF
jgi:hypothetical protein